MRNLTRKLLLSMFTLAICAVTLVSTTFAWYTTNEVVTAKPIEVNTSGDTDSSLLVKQQLTRDNPATTDVNEETWSANWSNYLNFTVDVNAALVPLQYATSNGNYTDLQGNVATIDTDYLEFTFKITSQSTKTEDIKVYFNSFSIVSEGEDTYDNLLYGTPQAGIGGLTSTQYMVDVLYAANLVIEDADSNNRVFGLDAYADKLDGFGSTPNPDAIAYYNAIMPNDITSSNPATGLTALPSLYTNASMPVLTTINHTTNGYEEAIVTIGLYIDGWDNYCFDACKGQKITLNFSLSVNDPRA